MALAVVPETGIYSTGAAGTGMTIEVQGSTIAANWCMPRPAHPAGYECVLGTGTIRNDATIYPLLEPQGGAQQGLFPMDWAPVTFSSVRGSATGVLRTEPFGNFELYFIGTAQVRVCSNQWPDDPPITQCITMQRNSFGIGSTPGRPSQERATFSDLTGSWVFADVDDGSKNYRFDLVRSTFVTTPTGFVIAYIDAWRNSSVVCNQTTSPGPTSQRTGCTASIGGAVVFSFNAVDYGVDTIEAFRGPLPPFAEEPFRRVNRIQGFKLRPER